MTVTAPATTQEQELLKVIKRLEKRIAQLEIENHKENGTSSLIPKPIHPSEEYARYLETTFDHPRRAALSGGLALSEHERHAIARYYYLKRKEEEGEELSENEKDFKITAEMYFKDIIPHFVAETEEGKKLFNRLIDMQEKISQVRAESPEITKETAEIASVNQWLHDRQFKKEDEKEVED